MASGSFDINTYSWYRSLPLSSSPGDATAYAPGTMFAVGECAFLKPYDFYTYQSTYGFTDTSTLSNALTSTNTQALQSTTSGLMSSIQENRRQIVSTIPLTRWISANITQNFPFSFMSTVPNLTSTIPSSIISTIPYTLISTGLFGFVTSNLYPTCAPYSLFSTVPVVVSSFAANLASSIQSNFQSTMIGPYSIPFEARSEIYNFTSTISSSTYPLQVQFDTVWLGKSMQDLIDSGQYNIFVDCQYTLSVSTNQDQYTWVSSMGAFGLGQVFFGNTYKGRTTVSRIGNFQTMEIHTKQMFIPEGNIKTQLAPFNSNYYMNTRLLSSIYNTGTGNIWTDIFVPGDNNFTFTLVPIV